MKYCTIIFLVFVSCSSSVHLHKMDVKKAKKPVEIKSLTKAFKNPEMVYKLNLSGENLTEIPATISGLVHLEELDISNSQFEIFPKEICELTNLTHLIMNNCNVTMIPDCISNLERLEYLWLMNNGEIKFPQTLARLKNLKQLNIAYNAISESDLTEIKAMLPQSCKILYYH